jgi:hypothetical protein
MNNSLSKYTVEIVFVIDATGSMGEFIDEVKQMAVKFHKMLADGLGAEKKGIESLRARVITFRDVSEEGDDAIRWSEFFELPDQGDRFTEYIESIEAMGGGDEPESALDALWVAIRSPWRKTRFKSRQIIVVFTDASAHPVSGRKPRNFQDSVPFAMTIHDVQSGWGTAARPGFMDPKTKRLLVFAPNMNPWTEIDKWENVTRFPSQAGNGCTDVSMKRIIALIVGSV